MSIIEATVISIACDDPGHIDMATGGSTFSGTCRPAAIRKAQEAGWRVSVVDVVGAKVERHECPRCVRRKAAAA